MHRQREQGPWLPSPLCDISSLWLVSNYSAWSEARVWTTCLRLLSEKKQLGVKRHWQNCWMSNMVSLTTPWYLVSRTSGSHAVTGIWTGWIPSSVYFVEFYMVFMLLTFITPSLFHSRLKPSFSANPSHRSLPFLLQDWLHGFPADCLPTLLSIYIFYFLVFLFSTFLVVGSVW